MAGFAEPTDVETAYEGSLPAGSETRVEYLLATISARLRILMPTLEQRASADPDLALLAKDTVVRAVIRRLPGNQQQMQSQTEAAGPFSTTYRYTTDSSRTFPDDDLDLLRGAPTSTGSGVGTIRIGRPDWHNQ